MQYSYSRVSLFKDCPYHFKLRYIDKLKEIPDYSANSPLILGHAMHKGIETNKDEMLDDYFNSFPIIDDLQIEEAIKLEHMLPKVQEWMSQFEGLEIIHEYKIDKPEYLGFVDLIIKSPDGSCMVVDFKYSKNIKNYMDSEQMHIYKHYLEQDGFNVDRLGFLFVEKVNLKQTKSEDTFNYRKRLVAKLKQAKVTFVPIGYDASKVNSFKKTIKEIEATKIYKKNVSGNCFSCAAIDAKKSGRWTVLTAPDYLEAIQNKNGEIEMVLPSSERRSVEKVTKRVFWLYGAPFSGKTTFANDFPNPLMLNTDGNIRFVDAPFISIADKTEVKGRITETTKAWELFKDAISDLEKKDNDFQTVIVDLLEDTYEACRLYMYEKMEIEHESDNSFKAWDMVRTEFLSTMKRVVHLDYENIIFLSHEDTSKDVTKKSGDKITSIKPNLQEKAALKVAGMVDIVGRVIADDEDRKIVFKSKDYVFGGGRLPDLPVNEIELDVDALTKVYDEANSNLKPKKKVDKPKRDKKEEVVDEEPTQDVEEKSEDNQTEEPPKRKNRRKEKEDTVEETEDDTPPGETEPEEKPKRQRRERTEEPKEEEKPKRDRRNRRGRGA
ncbi:AAA family ATPase [Vagococcus fluvialis]|uniref:AAA family ATPase n=1 Tax=Vagococcus fluvialis TaxID=2738 RepID=UPI0037B8AEFE